MEKPIRLLEFLISLLILVGVGVTAWVNINREQADQEARIRSLELNYASLNIKIDAISTTVTAKTDRILDKLDAINIKLENKKDRDDAKPKY